MHADEVEVWVLALALQLRADGHVACIVTQDTVDRNSLSIATACRRLGLEWRGVRSFFEHCEIAGLKPAPF